MHIKDGFKNKTLSKRVWFYPILARVRANANCHYKLFGWSNKEQDSQNPIQTIREMAQELGVLEKFVKRAVGKLGARLLAQSQRFLLKECLKGLRLEHCKKILWISRKKHQFC